MNLNRVSKIGTHRYRATSLADCGQLIEDWLYGATVSCRVCRRDLNRYFPTLMEQIPQVKAEITWRV